MSKFSESKNDQPIKTQEIEFDDETLVLSSISPNEINETRSSQKESFLNFLQREPSPITHFKSLSPSLSITLHYICPDSNFPQSLLMKISPKTRVHELLENFNLELTKSPRIKKIKFSTDYELYLCKSKKIAPKEDIPAFDYEQFVSAIKEKTFFVSGVQLKEEFCEREKAKISLANTRSSTFVKAKMSYSSFITAPQTSKLLQRKDETKKKSKIFQNLCFCFDFDYLK